MTEESIAKIRNEVSERFGMPESPRVDEDWALMESSRRVVIGNIQEPHCLAPLIDHTLLSPGATSSDIRALCQEATEHRFASVCVNPCRVRLAAGILDDSPAVVCTVIGFPLGANVPETKAEEALRMAEDGARELDMVMNIGMAKGGNWEAVHADVASVVESVYPLPVKVILESCLLDDEEIIRASLISKSAGAAYVKTSTGFSKAGATARAVEIMSAAVGETVGVKASGGIGDFEKAMAMFEAGATRIGASRSLQIIGK